jgi:hypothetical protein
MTYFRPRAEELPAEFPIFPLAGALLLPRGRLPLNIFEPRYLAMVEDALAAGRMVAMIQPDRSAPEGPTGPGLFRVGCLGRLSSFSETDDGRFLITLSGLVRFALVGELAMRRGYRRVRGDIGPFLGDLDPSPRSIEVEREALLAALRLYFARRGFEPNWEAIKSMPDDALVITLATVCPFETAEKQALLEAVTDSERAQALLALLQMGAADPDASAARVVS